MPAMITCLWFDTQAEQAAVFYTKVFPNSSVGAITRWPDGSGERSGQTLTVEFTLDSRPFVGLNGGPVFTFNEAVSIQVMCKDQEEIDYYWTALSADGGQEGDCGWCKDRFGLSWQVVPADLVGLLGDPDPGRAARAGKALFSMKKIDIGAIRAAADAG